MRAVRGGDVARLGILFERGMKHEAIAELLGVETGTFRRLTQAGSFSVEDDKNEVTVDVSSPMRAIDFTIEVPVHTNLHLGNRSGFNSRRGVDGDLEIDNVNGTVTLNNVRTRRRDGRQQIDVNKAIYGWVNGGGPDFEIRTFNGNVYVRKGK